MNDDVAAATTTTTQFNQISNQDKTPRRVAFSDSLPKHYSAISFRPQKSVCCTRLFACCGWICLSIFGFILVFLTLALIFLSFLQSCLPEITVTKLNFYNFQIENSTNQNNALLYTRVQMSIDMENKNDLTELTYSNFVVNLASEGVQLGKIMMYGYAHVPGNTTHLNLTMNVAGDSTDRDGALELEDDEKKVQMNVVVTMEGMIGFHIGILNMNNVPVHVACDFQQALTVYRVNQASCNIRMFPVRLK